MRRLNLLGLVLLAVFASSAALSASALALEKPENLPALKEGEKRTWTGKNVGNTLFRTAGLEPVECTAAAALEGTETSSKPPSGEFHIHFSNCTNKVAGATVKCTGLGEEVGIILALGTWELVFDREIGKEFKELTTAFLFKNNAVHFICGGVVLVEVLPGETVCLHLNPTVKAFTHEFHCFAKGTTTEPLEEYTKTEPGTFKVPVLLAGVSHPEKHLPAIQTGLGTVTYGVEIFADQ